MKEVLAVIRMNKINQTKNALAAAGFPSLTGSRVMGRGSRPVDYEVVAAAAGAVEPLPEVIERLSAPPRLISKRMLSLVVPDDAVQKIVSLLIGVNQTGRAGDGKIFVLPVSDAYRVRTGDAGEKAVSEMAGA